MRRAPRPTARPRRRRTHDRLSASSVARWRLAPALLALACLAGAPHLLLAEEDRWSVDVEGVDLSISGLDRQVLTDQGGGAAGTAVRLDTSNAHAWRTEIRRAGERWSFGVDFLWFVTNQNAMRTTGAASPGGLRTFVVGGGDVVSSGPGEGLYYQRLEDTTVEFWNADLVASRVLTAGNRSELRIVFGLRAADFDNDYRAVVGIDDVGGLRLDASSNYDRMHGPLVALVGSVERGRSTITGYLGQSVVWGDVELFSSVRDFVGPPSLEVDNVPNVIDQRRFTKIESASIPITEARIKWRYRLTDRFAVGLGAFYQRWGDVPVPPGVDAGAPIDRLAQLTMEAGGVSAGITVLF